MTQEPRDPALEVLREALRALIIQFDAYRAGWLGSWVDRIGLPQDLANARAALASDAAPSDSLDALRIAMLHEHKRNDDSGDPFDAGYCRALEFALELLGVADYQGTTDAQISAGLEALYKSGRIDGEMSCDALVVGEIFDAMLAAFNHPRAGL